MTNSLIKKEVINALKYRYFVINTEESNTLLRTNGYDMALKIVTMEALVRKLIESNEPLFSIQKGEDDRTFFNKKNSEVYGVIKPFIASGIKDCSQSYLEEQIVNMFPTHSFNPYFNVFIRNMDKKLVSKISPDFPRNYHGDELVKAVSMLNEFIDSIRSEAGSKEFKGAIKNYERLPRKNYKSLMDYVKNLISKYPELMASIVYFGYSSESHIRSEDLSRVKQDYKSFIDGIKLNSLFEHGIGYAWKLEHTSETGFYYRILFLFDGSMVQDDSHAVKIIDGIGKCWENTISGDNGLYVDCTTNNYLWNDLETSNDKLIKGREKLKKVAECLIMPDYYIRVNIHGKTFSKGG